MKFIDLSKEDRADVLDRVSTELNIRQREVVEKEWWVTAVLRAIFCLPYAQHLSFKGGTSLSKCWHLIDRFSEDIDGEDGLYVLPKVKVEVSGRSMSEPVDEVALDSMIDQVYPKAPFAEPKFNVRAVLPGRTFIEKIFLLHEEFAKPKELIRVERMSRHMYDIGQILKTPIAEKAIHNELLYRQVVEYLRTFIGLRGFDYDTLYPDSLNIVPPEPVAEQWKADYENMRLHMIYGESDSFEELVAKLKCLNDKIKGIRIVPQN